MLRLLIILTEVNRSNKIKRKMWTLWPAETMKMPKDSKQLLHIVCTLHIRTVHICNL